MPIADLNYFRDDVHDFIKRLSREQKRLGTVYTVNSAPEIAAIQPKIVQANAMYFNGEKTLQDLWNVPSMDEMVAMAGMLRYVFDEVTVQLLARNPLAENIKVEAVNLDDVRAEWQVTPEAVEGRVLLYFHGGGWVLGSPLSHRLFTVALGQAMQMRVLSVDYRLAPEHPFPAALEDCTKAYKWLLDHDFQPENILFAGDSAGGNLALATILNLRDEEMLPLPRGAACFSPCTSFVPSDWNLEKGKTDPILTGTGTFWWTIAYLGQEYPADPLNPSVSPLLGDLHGFPPILVQATLPELLYEQGQRFVEKALDAGIDATLQTWDGLVHVWQAFGLGVLPEAQEAIDKAGEWARNLFS